MRFGERLEERAAPGSLLLGGLAYDGHAALTGGRAIQPAQESPPPNTFGAQESAPPSGHAAQRPDTHVAHGAPARGAHDLADWLSANPSIPVGAGLDGDPAAPLDASARHVASAEERITHGPEPGAGSGQLPNLPDVADGAAGMDASDGARPAHGLRAPSSDAGSTALSNLPPLPAEVVSTAAAPATSPNTSPPARAPEIPTVITPPPTSPAAQRTMSGTWPRQTVDVGFTQGLAGWNIRQSGGHDPGRGAVTEGSAILHEGNSFLVALDQAITIPSAPVSLSFTYTASFDTTDSGAIKDAFEAVLTTADGTPLAHGFAPEREAYFNRTEQLASALGAGTQEEILPEVRRVTTDISQLAPGTSATLLFRLVNNDADVDTTIHILTVELTSGDDAPPVVTVGLANDTAPEGPGSEPLRSDLLTNDPRITGTATDDHSITQLQVQVDDGALVDITTSLVDGQYTFDPGMLAPGAHRLTVRATDTLLQTTDAVLDVTVNAPPVANAGGARTASEGDSLVFDSAGSTDADGALFQAVWTFHDGVPVTAAATSHIYRQDGTVPVSLTVIDTAGSQASDQIQVTVHNVAPTIVTASDLTGEAGVALVLTAAFIDPGVLDVHVATIDWGDGSTSQALVTEADGQGTVSAMHAYAAGGTYPIRVLVTDDAQETGERLATATITGGATASLTGYVYLDVNNNGMKDLLERGLPNVPVTVGGPVARSVTTGADGAYRFPDLPPGTYHVSSVQALAFLDGRETPGTPSLGAVGDDEFYDLQLAAGMEATDYNFGELGLRPELIGKYLYLASTPTVDELLAHMMVSDERWFAFQAPGTGVLTATLPIELAAPHIEVYTQGMLPLALTEGQYGLSVAVEEGAGYVLYVAGSGTSAEFETTLQLALTDAPLPPRSHYYTNPVQPLDTTGDGSVSPLDALVVINALNRAGYVPAGSGLLYLDVTGDSLLSPRDALLVINHLTQGDGPEGEASPDPPVLTLSAPAGTSQLPAGDAFVLTGQATDGSDPAASVHVNGQPVQALDAAGNFFQPVQLAPGSNTFVLEARDATGDQTTQSITITGTQLPGTEIDFSRLSVVSGSTLGVYGRTSWDDRDSALDADFGVTNVGQYPVDGPVLVGVANISDPSVRLRAPDGMTPEGIPYFDLSSLVTGGSLQPGDSSGLETISFFAPHRTGFTYDLVFFAAVNQAPRITTAPDVEAISGHTYVYDVDATDPDEDTLTFSLAAGPAGMEVSADTGRLTWTPTTADLGPQTVIVQADDGRGGVVQQHYALSVTEPPPNRPPVFTSVPPVAAQVNTEYRYHAQAKDSDADQLSFSLVSGPVGLAIDAPSGEVTWTPTGDQVGRQDVVLQVSDDHGGTATQTYAILLGQERGNTPPVIISAPVLNFDVSDLPNPASGDVTPIHIDLDLGPGQSSVQTVSLTLPPVTSGQSFADILFVVDETITMAGDHDWLEGMIPELDAALQARGIGPNRFILVGFGNFIQQDVTGPPHPHNLLETATLTMFGPTTSAVVGSQSLGPVLPLAAFEVTSATTGQQLVLVSDTTDRSGSYRLHLLRPGVTNSPLVLGGLTSGSIDVPSEKDNYTFTIGQPSQVYFDSYTNNRGIKWSLVGPAGSLVSNRPFTASDGRFAPSSSTLNLVPGNYTLTVSGDSSVIAPYQFRLSDLTTATPIVPGTPVIASRDPANETDLYQFNAAAGDRFYFDLVTGTAIDDPFWKLIDPYGNLLFNREFRFTDSADLDVLTLAQPGTYTLLVEGGIADSAANTYTFNVQPAPVSTTAMVLGEVVSGAIATAGDQDRYTFSLPAAALAYFDSLTNNGNVRWTLTGPAGALVSDRAFSASDVVGLPNPVISLVAGDYTLTVDGFGQTTGDYAFRLSDLAAATVLVPGTPVSGSLSVANETDLYRFDAVAGDRFSFDAQARTGALNARWRLADPYGTILFNNTFGDTTSSDVATLTLTQPGSYVLLLEGSIFDTGSGSYTFAVMPQGNEPLPPPPTATPLVLGTTLSDAISAAGEQDRFSFNLSDASLLHFDALTNNGNLNWTLVGPAGTAVSARTFTASDGASLAGPPGLSLVAGAYTLTVAASGTNTGSYSFRLSDLAQAPPLTPGTPVSGELNPGNETDLYRFAAAAGDRFYFDVHASSFGGALSAQWKLVDPYGNSVFNNFFGNLPASEVDSPTLTQSGTYTLLVEGPIAANSSGSYTFNVQPVTIATTPLTFGDVASGAIAVAGEQDHYTFTLPSTSLLYFDAHTNNTGLTWTLAGPAGIAVGNRPFPNDAARDTPVLNLVAGDYTLIVDGTADQGGAYAFRLSNLDSVAPLTPGTPVTGQLSPANETDLYQFTAAAGDRFFFDVQASSSSQFSRWQLIDPYGNRLFINVFSNAPVSDVEVRTLAEPGTYTLLLEGAISDTTVSTYTINVEPFIPTTAPLTLDEPVNGAIAKAGDQDLYTFSLDSAALLAFDSLTNSGVLTWSLAGPTGAVVSSRALNVSDGINATNPVVNVPAGDYTLTVDGVGDATGAYSFRLNDLAAATELVPGTPVSGEFTSANETDMYRFNVTGGDRFYFDVQARSGAPGARWRLINPFGAVRFSSDLTSPGSDVDNIVLGATGTFTLLLEGAIGDTTPGTYTFNVQPSPIVIRPLTLGATVSGEIAIKGEQDRYTFSLSAPSLLYFDSQTNGSGLIWTLAGPAGTAISARSLSDAETNTPPLDLPAGDYSLTIHSPLDVTSAYTFRLSELSAATVLTPGTPVTGDLTPGNQSHLYAFAASAGEQFFFDVQARTGQGARWRLIGPSGNILFSELFNGAADSVGPLTIAQTGTYTLLVEGVIGATTPGTYTFNVQPVTIVTQPLTLGSTVNGVIDVTGDRDLYTFTLPAASLVYFDALTSNVNLAWTLSGPAGTPVLNRSFGTTDATPVLSLVAGQYTLTVDGVGKATGAYGLRLSDLSSATALTPDTPASGSLDPANETDLFRFSASANERYSFDVQERSNGGGSRWRLVDPLGSIVFSSGFGSSSADIGVTTLALSGTYTLLLEGAVGDTVSGTYTFVVVSEGTATPDPPPPSTPLVLGTIVSDSISASGQQDRYTFTLPTAGVLCFDSLTANANLAWSLAGPTGTVANNINFASSDAANGNPVLPLVAGDYTLTVAATGASTGDYSFRLSELSSATDMVPGTPIDGSFDPANETDLYRFTASAGDRFYFDTLARTNAGNDRWRLVDPFGNILFVGFFTGADVDVITVAQSGTYTLLVEGGVANSAVGGYTFNVHPAPLGTSPLVLGSVTHGALTTPGAQHRYTFTLPAAAVLCLDSLTNNANLTWSLSGPTGTVVNNRSFTSSDSVNGNPVLRLPAGDYALVVDATGDATGEYALRLSDMSSATPIMPGTPFNGTLDPGNETDLYQFSAAAGDKFYFDMLARSGAPSGRWRLVDPYGNVLFSNPFDVTSAVEPDVLTLQAGQYTLLLEGHVVNTAGGAYGINVQPVTFSSQPVSFGEVVQTTLSAAGEQDDYTFTGTVGQRVFFDGLASTINISARLFAPSTDLVFSVAANSNFGPFFLPESGTYRLNLDGLGDVFGPYGFELHDVASATELDANADIAGALDLHLGSDLFLVNAAAGDTLVFTPTNELYVGTAEQVSAATRSLVALGNVEDGYEAIDAGLDLHLFREGAAINVVLLTDENRDVVDSTLSFDSTFSALTDIGALINGIHEAHFRDGNGQDALGVDSQGIAYLADGAGGFIASPGGEFVSGRESTKADYVDLEWALGGAAWDVTQLRVGGLPALSFTKAFVEIKTNEIEEQLSLDVVSSDANAGFQNLTGVVSGATGGETASFDIMITGDGSPHSFDLNFIRPDANIILGSIPVTINGNNYLYPVRAVDADGDPLTYSLVESPVGAAIDATSGRITWTPPAAGVYRFVVRADDGRGGRDSQEYDVIVTTGAPNEPPTITSAAPEQATGNLPFDYPVTAIDPDGDRLSYFLTQAPAGMAIDGDTGLVMWTPTTQQIGTHEVTVRVLDGRGGAATQTFTLSVVADTGNRPPQFVSSPLADAFSGEFYRYEAMATDADGDALVFDLVVKPSGMTIDPTSGEIAWRPTAEHVGRQHIIVRARDGRGGVDLQSYDVLVGAAGTAPLILPPPPSTPAVALLPYAYRFYAQDADGDALTFRLTAGADGMTINPDTGVLSWTPTLDQIRAHVVIVSVEDSSGLRDSVEFTLTALASAPNVAPVISSAPRTGIQLGASHLYAVDAVDENDDRITLTLPTAPAGMTLDPATRLVQWVPAPDQLGDNNVEIRASDGRGGVAVQSFVIEVTATGSNEPPRIVSTPVVTAVKDTPYAYDLRGLDPDGDPLVWSLDAAPRGMSIHELLGTIRWTPAADQVGPADVVVLVTDAQGGRATQRFTINVRAVNSPPSITSVPPTQGNVGQGYRYAVQATDPDNDPLYAVSFPGGSAAGIRLTTFPAGMSIDAATGLVQWTPTTSQVGPHDVVVEVSDGQGGNARQSFTVVVDAAPINRPPTITTRPVFVASAGLPYMYDLDATDPESDALTFALTGAPSGMAIDPGTGRIDWTPGDAQVGSQRVTVTVSDTGGNVAGQSYALTVQPANQSPLIDSTPLLSATAGLVYRYDVQASDADGNTLTYQLQTAPAGMTVDDVGRISWPTTVSDMGTHAVTVVVTDSFGAAATQSFNVEVSADTQPPSVLVEFNITPADVGTDVIVFVSATDNVAVTDLLLTLDSVPLKVDARGLATFPAERVGSVEVTARAADAAGNTQSTTEMLSVIDPNDIDGPLVSLTSPTEDAVITAPAEVIGTVTDDNLLFYTLSVAPLGSAQFVEIARGTTGVADGLLGTFDPTLLENDSYVLRLEATDAGGNVAAVEQAVQIGGDLKLGNFTLSFTDLTVPVFGVPITVTRTYDTLAAAQSSDFGFGWRLEFRNMNLRTSVAPTGFEEYGIFNPLKVGSRVYVTIPGGNRQAFTFQPQVASGIRGGFLGIFEPRFVPDPGVKSSLTVTPADLRINADGRVFDYTTGEPYNPASSLFGGSYLLTTKQGMAFDIDGRTGQLTALADPGDNRLTFSDAGITGPEGVSVAFERDPQGRIAAVVDPAGQRIGYRYDARGDLVAVTDRADNTTQYEYRTDLAHYLREVIDPLGRAGVRSEYDALGRLNRVVDAAGNPVQFAYDPSHLISTVTDALGNTKTDEYDERGNIVRQIDALGGITLRTFDADNNTLSETDPLGHTTTFTYNDRGDALTRTDPLGNTTISTFQAFTYGTTTLAATRGQAAAPFTRVTTSTDALGNTTVFDYHDDLGDLLSTTDPAGNVVTLDYDRFGRPPSVMTDALGHVTRFESLNGLLMRHVDALGNATSFTYDANGNELTSTTTLTAADGTRRTLTTITEHDAEGRVVAVTDAEGGVTRTEYDAAGNRTATIDALGRRTEYHYDERDLRVETVFPDNTPADLADNPRTHSQYDALGRETARIDESGRRTEFQYDAAGRLVRTIYPDATPADPLDNPFTRTEYDAVGQETAQIDELGNRTEFGYDDAGRLVVVRDALGHATLTAYDAAGRRVRVTDALGHTTQLTTDARGLLVRTTYADGSSTHSEYSALGQLVARTDQQGATIQYGYDALGQLTAVVDALGHRTEYTLDEAGHVIRSQDANGRVTTYAYDGRGRRVSTTLPLGQRSATNYDAVGNVVSQIDFNGQTIHFEYDARNRITTKDFSTGMDTSFAYTLTGQRAMETDARGTTTYTYDSRDRLLSRSEPDGAVASYTYDDAGHRTSVTATVEGSSLTTSYTFDAVNRVSTVTAPDLGVTRYTYDPVGNLTRTEFPSGIDETRSYDDLNRLVFLEHASPSEVMSSYTYAVSPSGQRNSVTELDGRRVDYSYDALNRVTREAITDAVFGNKSIDYTYDAVGNRLSRNDSVTGLTEYTYDANDRLLTETLAGELTEYTYDNNGNTLSRVSATDQVFSTWDAENRLIAADITDANGTRRVDYQYDANGIRVTASIDGQETRYLIDANQALPEVLLEYTPSGLVVVSYVLGRDLISQVRSGTPSFYLADGSGSIRALTTAAGSITDRYIYDAFGVPISSLGTTPNTYRFAGEQFDQNLDLVYLRARYLNPQSGRFASADPFPGLLSDPTSLHRFVYAGGDPVNRIDPSGQFAITIELSFSISLQGILRGIGATVGGIIGHDEGGIAGLFIGTISGAFLLGRFGSWLVRGAATELGATAGSAASREAAKVTLGRVSQKGASYAHKGLLTSAPGRLSSFGRNASLGVVPLPVFVDVFRSTREEEPSGDEALCLLDGLISEMAANAGDLYTAEYYLTLLASLRAAGGAPCPSEIPDA